MGLLEEFGKNHYLSGRFQLIWEDEDVRCPRCGAYHGTKIGLRTNEPSRKCVGWCDSIVSQSKFIINAWWGQDFPIRYDTRHILAPYKSNAGVIKRLLSVGYKAVTPSEVMGLDLIEKSEWLVPKNIYRRDHNDTLICPEDRFVDFVEKNKPTYLEIKHRVNGNETITYLKYEEIGIIRKIIAEVQATLSRV